MGVLRVKAGTEAFQQSDGSDGNRANIWIRVVLRSCSQMTYLTMLANSCLKRFELFVEVLPHYIGPSARSIYDGEFFGLLRQLQRVKGDLRRV